MSNLNNSDLEQMLYQFVDGELPPEQESILFAELSANDELRADMKDLMTIREAVNADTEAFNPPPDVTSTIYKRIGMIPPLGIATQTPNGLWLICKRYAIPVAAAFMISLVSYFGYYNYSNKFIDTQNNSVIQNTNKITSNAKKEIPNVSSNEVVKIKKDASKPSLIKSKENKNITNNPIISLANNSQVITELDKSESYESDSKMANSIMFFNSNLYNGNLNVSKNNYGEFKNSPLKYTPEFSKVKLYDISVRGITSAASFPGITQSNAKEPVLTNLSIGSYMHQWDNFRIGIELGQEPFGQEFKNQNQISYVNQSSLFWAAIGFQGLVNNPLFNNSQFFGRVLLGSSEIGPLGKALIGIQYQPFEVGYALQIGLEGSILSYENQGTAYSTQKIALTYGISWIY